MPGASRPVLQVGVRGAGAVSVVHAVVGGRAGTAGEQRQCGELTRRTGDGESSVGRSLVDRDRVHGQCAVVIERTGSRGGGRRGACAADVIKVAAGAIVLDRRLTGACGATGVGGHQVEGLRAIQRGFLLRAQGHTHQQAAVTVQRDRATAVADPGRPIEVFKGAQVGTVCVLTTQGQAGQLTGSSRHRESRVR